MFQHPSEPGFSFIGERLKLHTPIIPTMKAQKILNKGCTGYLASIVDLQDEESSLDKIPIACEFPDVLPDDLLGLSPDREIEFGINLMPGTTPISKAPYRMVPTELKELKTQLQELLDKKFIRPSYYPLL